MLRSVPIAACAAFLITACGEIPDTVDATPPRTDGGIVPFDSGQTDQGGGADTSLGQDIATGQDAARPDTSTAQDAARPDSSTGQDAANGQDAATGVDAGGDCTADCNSGLYNACTCGADDPCGWIGDAYCDLVPAGASCDQFEPHFDDSADCSVELNVGWIGGACAVPGDCTDVTGATCETASFPGGFCTVDCDVYCPDAVGGYGTGTGNTITRCIVDDLGNGRCVGECDFEQSPTGCRPGYTCVLRQRDGQPDSIYPVCLPADSQGWPGEPAPAFDIGEACSADGDCANLYCMGMPGGYCAKAMCSVAGCPAGSTCYSLSGDSATVCLQDCSSDGECRTGEDYVCMDDADPDSLGDYCGYQPPPHSWDPSVGAADCASALAAGLSPCDLVVDDYIVVNKAARNLALCDSSGGLVQNFSAGLSSFAPSGDKEREGDGKTPEGVFFNARLVPNSSYYKAFSVSYPDAADATRGLTNSWISQSVHDQIVTAQNNCTLPPQQSELGGLIEVHGMGGSNDWTLGCVAIDSSGIDALWAVLEVGDSIVVLPD